MHLRCGITLSIEFSLTIWIMGLTPHSIDKNAVLSTMAEPSRKSLLHRAQGAYKGVLRVVKLKMLKNLADSDQNLSWQVLQP
jgi:hypothetical protein